MNVLMIHKFHYIEGGAERYVFNLSQLLQKKGDVVATFSMHHPRNFPSPYADYFVSYFNPDQLRDSRDPIKTLKKAAKVIYNQEAQRKLAMLIEETRPDIAHVHSVYHHISPSIMKTLKEYHIPVILTLHDFKLVCPNIVFLDGKNRICEACRGKYFWKATLKKCFRESYGASLLVTLEATIHNMLRSYKKNVDLFHSPSAFLAGKISEYGYGHKPVKVLPYTLDVDSFEPRYKKSDYFVYAGRMSVEKGVLFLIDAMKRIKGKELYLIGTGPLDNVIKQRIEKEKLDNIRMLGYKSGDELREMISSAAFTVMPSLCHDNSPLAIYESLSLGKAVLGASFGGIPELVEDGIDGYIFKAGDMNDFVTKANLLIDNPQATINMGRRGRKKALQIFAPDEHYEKIMELYEQTIELGHSV
ncbi:glycosyltransferase family 4 protein [candidate division KSB1 bacterium]|nr:glycosyltransferase family 4 protein [candidate division KSB1 bacterium]